MQEIKKRRIVLASLLKPVDDTRMYEKLGISLADQYDVTITGQPTFASISAGNISVRPLPRFNRLSIRRLLAPYYVLRVVLSARPDILIICSSELLPLALVVGIFGRTRIVYDVQENYAMNIRHGTAWPRFVRPLLAAGVRSIEWISAPIVDHYLLAEKSYASELRFIGSKFTIVENKVVRTALPFGRSLPVKTPQNFNDTGMKLLFTGTLADSTGVFEAIELARRLHYVNDNTRLRVIGYAAKADVRTRLKELAAACSFIQLEGIDQLVPHGEILSAIESAHFGIISYPRNVSTWSSYPTKLYEYLGRRLPVLLVNNTEWVNYCAPYGAAVVFDPDNIDERALLTAMTNNSFYLIEPKEVFWDSEVPKLLQALRQVLR
ncbi:glycosyltransferase [Chryseolinea sp. T2]|uniref:glycosyltransferase n=1 Tax=Chryseolinea sp. T2 TaxID=3129255 RepID=UPI0030772738